ncbi:MAG: DeoR/GlpR transcriptional regulator [Clostridia bacterium]|nr:DeoR/GlpR transcriptional regulator [Clostridia bacterium]
MADNLRHRQILDILARFGTVSVRALTKELYVSEATVRRDLAELEKAGALKRVFGGAKPILGTNKQVPLFIRESVDAIAKSEICRRAAELVKDGDSIFVDGSSTAQYLAKHLAKFKDIVVVTYSIKTAEIMCANHVKTYCTGGLIMENSLVCIGAEATDFADKINIDVCFMSCKGVDEDGNFTDTSAEETAVRRAFLKKSKRRICLMTNNKFGSTYFHTLCSAKDVDYIFSDGQIPPSIKTRKEL